MDAESIQFGDVYSLFLREAVLQPWYNLVLVGFGILSHNLKDGIAYTKREVLKIHKWNVFDLIKIKHNEPELKFLPERRLGRHGYQSTE